MVDKTTHHGWNRPETFSEEDKDKWGDQLNTTLDDVDEAVVIKGTTSGTPPTPDIPAGVAGRWYLATDTLDPSDGTTTYPFLYYDDGTSWYVFEDGNARTFGGKTADKFVQADGSVALTANLPVNGNTLADVGSLALSNTAADISDWTVQEDGTGNLIADYGGTTVFYVAGDGAVFAMDAGSSNDRLGTRPWANGKFAQLSRFPIPNSDLQNSSVTVAGNAVGLGGTTAVALNDLSDLSVGTPSAGDVLEYDGTNWVPATDDTVPTKAQARQANFQVQTVPAGDYAAQRIRVPTGQTFSLFELGVQKGDGTTDASVTVQVEDGAGTAVDSTSTKATQYDSGTAPTVAGAADIVIKLDNATTADVNATAHVVYTVA